MLRWLLSRFLGAVDGEGVALFQWLFYLILITAGTYNLAVGNPPLSLIGAMTVFSFKAWCWLNIAGPCCCLIGKAIKRSPHYGRSGQWMRLTGDATLSVSLLAYVVATFQVEHFGRGSYGGFLGIATWIATLFLILRDVRRLLGKRVAA